MKPVTHVAVNLDALRHNAKQVLGAMSPQSRLLAVVKANAYGHGLVEGARVFLEAGASWLGVSTVSEGAALRKAGVDAPVLVFLPADVEEAAELVRQRLTATVISVRQMRELALTAQGLGQSVYAHIYLDGGLGRLGSEDSLPDIIEAGRVFPQLHFTGLYTHFGPPGSGQMLEELDTLRDGASVKAFAGLTREAMVQMGENRPLVHAAASSLFVETRDNHLDMVRVGTLLYGQYPDHVTTRTLSLREDTFALRSRIIGLQTLPAGAKIGYGGEFVCRRETRVATVPVGTAHGLGMLPQSVAGRWQTAAKAWLEKRDARRGKAQRAAQATVLGQAAPLLGRVSMDQCCLDVSGIPEADLGTEVTLPARRLAVDSAVARVYVRDEQ